MQQASIIGIPDKLQGEVPVAVVKDGPLVNKDQIKKLVVEGCGTDYALSEVYTLSELGFDTWPINDNGKVPKKDLRDAVVRSLGGK